MKTVAFVQARMGSTRLPGKVLMELAGKPVLQRVVERVQGCRSIDEVIVVTTFQPQDLPIVAWCANHGIRVFCGSEQDVLDRFYQAARLVAADVLLRITADCPLMDPAVIQKTLDHFWSADCDYANNVEHETYPDGLDVEVFRYIALERAWNEAGLLSEREHVTPYLRNHPDRFRLSFLDHHPSLSGQRWTLDQQEDWNFIQAVYQRLVPQDDLFGMSAVLELLAKEPELQKLNGSIHRNEGYMKSLHQDKRK